MDNNVIKDSFLRIFKMLKPWLVCGIIFLVLKYTGMIASVSSVTQKAILKTGALDAKPVEEAMPRKFDYAFELQDIDKNKFDIQSLKGKPIFINVWATWCGPCRAEMPSIQSLYTSLEPGKVQFIMLAVDQKNPFNKVKSFIQDKEYTFPVYLPLGNLPSQLQVRSIPATFVINREGKIVYSEAGAANYDTEEFRNFLNGL